MLCRIILALIGLLAVVNGSKWLFDGKRLPTLDLGGKNVGIDVFFVWIDTEVFSRVGRQSGKFCFVSSVTFFYPLVLTFF